ncbi:MAG: hypothetical protein WCK90_01030 [archaeon]
MVSKTSLRYFLSKMSATTAITGLTVIISLIGLFLWSFEWSPFQGWIEYFALKGSQLPEANSQLQPIQISF